MEVARSLWSDFANAIVGARMHPIILINYFLNFWHLKFIKLSKPSPSQLISTLGSYVQGEPTVMESEATFSLSLSLLLGFMHARSIQPSSSHFQRTSLSCCHHDPSLPLSLPSSIRPPDRHHIEPASQPASHSLSLTFLHRIG